MSPAIKPQWETVLVELLRFGADEGILRKGDPYLVVRANEPVKTVRMKLSHEDFLQLLEVLRYDRAGVGAAGRRDALAKVAGVVTPMLGSRLPAGKVQIDLVVSAKELAALPFEAAGPAGDPLVVREARTVEITRRVRGAFRDRDPRWPATPRVLLVAASPTQFVPADEHVQALRRALDPWIGPLDGVPEAMPLEDPVLTVLRDASLASIRDACRQASRAPFTHVHVLAHGVEIETGMRQKFGLRLHTADGRAAHDVTAEQLAGALSAGGALPMVVSLTACDTGNVGSTIVTGAGMAQTLHASGVPIVIGSQFPLTEAGSTVLVEDFYRSIFAGDDVRDALHQIRMKLHADRARTGHDWMSLVGYVQLPEGYADRLGDMRLAATMASLRAGQRWADHLANDPNTATADQYDRVAEQLRERIESLRRSAALPENAWRQALLEENRGLLGSAYKRLAELLVARASLGTEVERWRREAREALEESRRWYELAGADNLSAHWVWVQRLSLEAILEGRISLPWQWHATLEAATTACKRPDEIWAFGTRAELHLLARCAGEGQHLDEALQALRDLKARVRGRHQDHVESTKRQLTRYATWWTTANGYFPGTTDLAEDARRLVEALG